jgi:excisionase family DNA binding protein
MEADPLLTVGEAAEAFKFSTATIRRLLRDGDLEGVKLGKRQWRVRKSALDRFVNQGVQKPAVPKDAGQ